LYQARRRVAARLGRRTVDRFVDFDGAFLFAALLGRRTVDRFVDFDGTFLFALLALGRFFAGDLVRDLDDEATNGFVWFLKSERKTLSK
jgi:hypothetical protein